MPEVDGEKIYTFGPSILSTPERWRARFNSVYQAKNIIKYIGEGNPTQADFEKYVVEFPEEGDKLNRMQAISNFSGVSAATGLAAGTTYVARVTKSPPLILTGAFFSTVAAYFVGDDIGSWIYGTYKFDAGATREKFLKWVVDSRQPTSS